MSREVDFLVVSMMQGLKSLTALVFPVLRHLKTNSNVSSIIGLSQATKPLSTIASRSISGTVAREQPRTSRFEYIFRLLSKGKDPRTCTSSLVATSSLKLKDELPRLALPSINGQEALSQGHYGHYGASWSTIAALILATASMIKLSRGSFVVFAKEPLTEKQKIDLIIERVGDSNLIFIRNGKEHDCKDAKEHILHKMKYSMGLITTVERFIKYIATKSTITGSPYFVKYPDGTIVSAEAWVREQVKLLEQQLLLDELESNDREAK